MKPKVFGIGFHKTGTKSLAAALTQLGYRVTGPNGVHDAAISQTALAMALELVDQYDAFQDNPWPVLFRELDERFPGSKFILTVRPTAAWIRSVVNHFGDQDTPMREWIYGVGHPKGNEDVYVRRYEDHNLDVMAYFTHRPDDLLVFRVTDGDGWAKLCTFLFSEFPHLNRASVKVA